MHKYKKIYILLFLTAILLISLQVSADTTPHLVGSDGTYLGKLTTNQYDSKSVFNEIGKYGSDISMTSIWNDISPYGSSVSMKSAFNDVASNPPLIIYNNETIGYLTTNNIKPNSLNPKYLYSWLKDNGF
jgi:hypothetical protein